MRLELDGREMSVSKQPRDYWESRREEMLLRRHERANKYLCQLYLAQTMTDLLTKNAKECF